MGISLCWRNRNCWIQSLLAKRGVIESSKDLCETSPILTNALKVFPPQIERCGKDNKKLTKFLNFSGQFSLHKRTDRDFCANFYSRGSHQTLLSGKIEFCPEFSEISIHFKDYRQPNKVCKFSKCNLSRGSKVVWGRIRNAYLKLTIKHQINEKTVIIKTPERHYSKCLVFMYKLLKETQTISIYWFYLLYACYFITCYFTLLHFILLNVILYTFYLHVVTSTKSK